MTPLGPWTKILIFTIVLLILNWLYFALIARYPTVLIFGLTSITPHIISSVLPTIMSISVSWDILTEIVISICLSQIG